MKVFIVVGQWDRFDFSVGRDEGEVVLGSFSTFEKAGAWIVKETRRAYDTYSIISSEVDRFSTE